MKNNIKKGLLLLLIQISMVINAQTEFEQSAISIGVVVSDIDASTAFYKDVVGMIEVPGFNVTSEVAKKTGLTGGLPLQVTVLKLEDSPTATEWKLMSFEKEATHPKQQYIQDDTGMQYITIFPKDMKDAIARIKKHKVPTLGETPTKLPNGKTFILIQDPDGTFIELIGDL
ncbi:VOC family protein [uncultured Dokdonia sp.]|uniref:VOC family protein n=1 Tax=uncultured Dokdonia sp. TaxID=575653 RepID=UPI00260650C1|nr:VOC family protein [uncultured Dokdonia sp.]